MSEYFIDQKFPEITNKDEFLAEIADLSEIGIIDKGDYTVVQYNVAFPETFLSPYAREARGIVFDNSTGCIIRRPFHKFFNVNEKAWTQLEDLADDEVVWVADKLDGTLIVPFLNNNEIVWGTKRVAEDFHDAVVKFLKSKVALATMKSYEAFVRRAISLGYTPMFEFHDPSVEGSVIVIQYGEAFLRLIGMRNMKTGQYVDIPKLEDVVHYEFPEIQKVKYDKISSLQEIKDELSDAENTEGRVVMLRDAGLVKMKSPWYVKRHNIKSLFGFAHIKAQLVLEVNPDASMDDIAPEMLPEDVVEFERFSEELHAKIDVVKDWLVNEAAKYNTRKEYGLAKKSSNMFSGLVFRVIGEEFPEHAAYELAVENVKKNVNKGIRFQEWLDATEAL